MPITSGFLELIGYFLAEGHAEDSYFIISCNEKEMQLRLERSLKNQGLSWRVRSNGYDYVVAWTLYAHIFATFCGARAKEKHLPDFWPRLSQRQLAILLSAYFTGDGGIEGDKVTVTTASSRLACELSYGLARFGIWARISKKFKRATNSSHKGDIYNTISISGSDQLKRFAEHIGFLLERKERQLAALLWKTENTNVDVIPISGADIRSLRTELGLCQKELARDAQCCRPLISMIESDRRKPSRKLFERIMSVLESQALKEEKMSAIEICRRLRQLGKLRWTPVKTVYQETCNHKWVYDLSIAENETFLGRIWLFADTIS